jgi:hypothetical protein
LLQQKQCFHYFLSPFPSPYSGCPLLLRLKPLLLIFFFFQVVISIKAEMIVTMSTNQNWTGCLCSSWETKNFIMYHVLDVSLSPVSSQKKCEQIDLKESYAAWVIEWVHLSSYFLHLFIVLTSPFNFPH